ncbi:hypothetical protein TRVA0_073S00188 [Trichomonascus vanleenenianus]|uniref:uncharacterized protein n=1 Tax=Trichomonascus vanleenenianus TaxID=2268995 RepID=UPI003ECA7AC8
MKLFAGLFSILALVHSAPAKSHKAQSYENILGYLGTDGPFHAHDVEDWVIGAETGTCRVDQVHLLARHGERFPNLDKYMQFGNVIGDLKAKFGGTNSIIGKTLEDYELDFMQPTQQGELTTVGQFSGASSSWKLGTQFKARYSGLIEKDKTVAIHAANSERVLDTARNMLSGFIGKSRSKIAVVDVMPDRFDTPAPGRPSPSPICPQYDQFQKQAKTKGKDANFVAATVTTISRLVKGAPPTAQGNSINALQVSQLCDLCAYELDASGSSPICNMFIPQEWEANERSADYEFVNAYGPGNPYAKSVGIPYLTETFKLLQNSSAIPVHLTFVHHETLAAVLTALEIVPKDAWSASAMSPMSGRVVFERLYCDNSPDLLRIAINNSYTKLFCGDIACNLGEFIDKLNLAYSQQC